MENRDLVALYAFAVGIENELITCDPLYEFTKGRRLWWPTVVERRVVTELTKENFFSGGEDQQQRRHAAHKSTKKGPIEITKCACKHYIEWYLAKEEITIINRNIKALQDAMMAEITKLNEVKGRWGAIEKYISE